MAPPHVVGLPHIDFEPVPAEHIHFTAPNMHRFTVRAILRVRLRWALLPYRFELRLLVMANSYTAGRLSKAPVPAAQLLCWRASVKPPAAGSRNNLHADSDQKRLQAAFKAVSQMLGPVGRLWCSRRCFMHTHTHLITKQSDLYLLYQRVAHCSRCGHAPLALPGLPKGTIAADDACAVSCFWPAVLYAPPFAIAA